MAYAAGAELAHAVSRAGGLGMIGFGSGHDARNVTEAMETTLAQAPIGCAFMAWSLEKDPEPLDAALEARPALVCVSFGDLARWVERVHAAGVPFTTQVGNAADIDHALDVGVDVLIVRGREAGGHGRDDLALVELFDLAQERAGEVPLVAAGGIATRDDVCHYLARGASACAVGTRFLTAREANTREDARSQLRRARGCDTVYTRVFDVAQGLPWPAEFGGRALRTDFVDRWQGRLDELAAAALPSPPTPIYAGCGVGECGGEESAADICRALTP